MGTQILHLQTGAVSAGECLSLGRGLGNGHQTPRSTPVRAACPQAARPGMLPAGREPSLLSAPPGLQQLELVSVPHGPPSACDLPAGRAGSTSGTRRAASVRAQPELSLPHGPSSVGSAPTASRTGAQSSSSPCWGLFTGVNATATPASARRTRRDGWRACASTTRPAPTASAASPSTRTGPGLAAPPRPPTSVSVSGTGGCAQAGGVVALGRKRLQRFARLLQPGRVDLHPRAPVHSITPRTPQHFFTLRVQPSAPSTVPHHGATL